MAATVAKLPTWYRALAVIVGVLAMVSALIVLMRPLLAIWLLIFLLAVGLLVVGMDRLAAGISGQPFWWAQPPLPSTPGQSSSPISTTGTAPKP